MASTIAHNMPALASTLSPTSISKLQMTTAQYRAAYTSKTTGNPHDKIVTGGIIILGPKILLVKRAATEIYYPNMFEFPSGNVDETDASILHSLIREVMEEIGLIIATVLSPEGGSLILISNPPTNMFQSLLRGALIASATISYVSAIPTISIKGSKFFTNGQQFFLKGVAYQGTPDDPLVNTSQCQSDATLMATIGTNTIRVYHVDPTQNHDGCMKAFSDAGIYVFLDLDTFTTSIVSNAPTWTETQFNAFSKVADAMQGYDNLGGFFIGNEVITNDAQSNAAPYVRAAAADIKAYMALKKYRQIPVGYSAADIAELRPMLQNYLACGTDQSQNIDFFGLNSYEWCGDSSFTVSGYANLQQMAQGYSIPIFFSETGCNTPKPRLFTDQAAIFSANMSDTWSGAIIYEWVEETNDYGVVTYPNGKIYSGAPTPLQPDFNNLQNQWKSVNPSGIAEASYTPTNSAPACPSATGGWQVDGSAAIPRLDTGIISAAAGNPVATPAASSVSSAAASVTTTAPGGAFAALPSNATAPYPAGNGTAPYANGTAPCSTITLTSLIPISTISSAVASTTPVGASTGPGGILVATGTPTTSANNGGVVSQSPLPATTSTQVSVNGAGVLTVRSTVAGLAMVFAGFLLL
ncbi:hypothetical protein G7Y89_g12718 [Cudoniella acicularis]|uniref:1,3-beta-glucanosyltransferase n=1 Tax=Cudoniella acicularis TaxID=354080 RepID=A0A8H4RB00_9HELO|nr:hypothetical protein G7Y89_g12718 [Cudoniella acicularis]